MFIQAKRPHIKGVLSFTVCYLIGFVAFTLLTAQYVSLTHLGIQVILTMIVCWAHKNVQYHITLLWLLSCWGFLQPATELIPINTAGQTLNSLSVGWHFLEINHIVHLYGFAVVTWTIWQTLCLIIHSRYQRRLMPTTGLLLLCITSAIGYGAIHEIIEFFLAHGRHFCTNKYVTHNGWDMAANTLGACLAALIIKIRSL